MVNINDFIIPIRSESFSASVGNSPNGLMISNRRKASALSRYTLRPSHSSKDGITVQRAGSNSYPRSTSIGRGQHPPD